MLWCAFESLHSSGQGPLCQVRSSWAPDAVLRDGHASVGALTHKQRVLHLLTGAIIVWKGASAERERGQRPCSAATHHYHHHRQPQPSDHLHPPPQPEPFPREATFTRLNCFPTSPDAFISHSPLLLSPYKAISN